MNLSKAQRIAIPIFAVVVIIIIAVATVTMADLRQAYMAQSGP